MSSFTSPLIVSLLDNGKYWKLEKMFNYNVGDKYSSEVIEVPEGFLTDFASIPQIFWSILPPVDRWGKSAVIHDYLYKKQIYSRKRSDEIFLEGMEVLKVSFIKRKIIYYTVRLFGKFTWNKYKNSDN